MKIHKRLAIAAIIALSITSLTACGGKDTVADTAAGLPAVTGNAGPTKDDTDKSVGAVFIAFVSDTKEIVQEFNFGQPREKVIHRTVSKSLEILQKEIL